MRDSAGPLPSDPPAALRTLQSAAAEVDALRGGHIEPGSARGYVLRIANAVDRSLRRLLRDDKRADISIRLQALAPDEIRIDDVLAELRRNERLPMESAAAVHELFEVRRRLERGGEPTDVDQSRAVHVVELLSAEIERPAPAAATFPPEYADDTVEFEPSAALEPRWGVPTNAWGFGAILVVLLVAIGIWASGRGGPNEMEQGIALFQSGEYAEAANYFWRYAEQNPRDATPHLYLGRIHRRMERTDLAAEAIGEAQRLAPEDPAVHRELGFLLLDTGYPDRAVGRFRAAIEMDEQSSEGWVGLVRALRESGRAEEAESLIADAPAEARALLSRSGSS